MSLQSRQIDTYILFSDTLTEIHGPLFESEIPAAKERCANLGITDLITLNEVTFKSMYPQIYNDHLYNHWSDKVYTYICNNAEWIGSVFYHKETGAYSCNWFNCFQVTERLTGQRKIQINVHISANKFHAAKLFQDFNQMLPFPIRVGDLFYTDKSNQVHVNEKAIQVQLAEQMLQHMCLQ